MVRIDIPTVDERGMGDIAEEHLLHQPAVPGIELSSSSIVAKGVRVFHGLICGQGIEELVEKIVFLRDGIVAEKFGMYEVDLHRKNSVFSV
jgi:hypothetical protein